VQNSQSILINQNHKVIFMKPLFSKELNRVKELEQLFQSHEEDDFYYQLKLDQYRNTLLTLKRRVSEMKFRVAVIGEFSTGKSTFINALLHQNILPASFKPTTNQVMRIEQGDESLVCISDEPLRNTTLSTDSIIQLASETEKSLDIYTEIPEPMTQFVIYDTPGVNDPSALTEEIIFDLLSQSDIIIFLMRSDSALKETELRFLESLVCKKDLDKFFFVINFQDHLDPEGIKEVRSHVTNSLSKALNYSREQLNEKIMFCSAKQALDQALQNNFNDTHWKNFEELLSVFQRFSKDKKEDLEAAAIHSEIQNIIHECCQDIDVALDILSGKDQVYVENLQKINDEISSFKQRVHKQTLTFRKQIIEQQRILEKNIKQDFNDIKSNITDEIHQMSDEELQDREWIQKKIRRDIEDKITTHMQEFWEGLEIAYKDFDKATAPDLERSIQHIQGFTPGFNYTPIVTGVGLAGVSYAAVSSLLPSLLISGGLSGVAAVAAAFILPSARQAIAKGALTVVNSTAKGIEMLFTGGTKALMNGYDSLQKPVGNLEGSLKRKKYITHIEQTLNRMQMEAINKIDQSIDPDGLCELLIEQKFSQKAELEQRENKRNEISVERDTLMPELEMLNVFKKKLCKEMAEMVL